MRIYRRSTEFRRGRRQSSSVDCGTGLCRRPVARSAGPGRAARRPVSGSDRCASERLKVRKAGIWRSHSCESWRHAFQHRFGPALPAADRRGDLHDSVLRDPRRRPVRASTACEVAHRLAGVRGTRASTTGSAGGSPQLQADGRGTLEAGGSMSVATRSLRCHPPGPE